MPKYIVTNGSYFKPFSYEELAKPVEQMAAAHQATEDAYDVLSMETAALEKYLSENEGDRRAREIYTAYRDRLNTLQENLWNRGYTPQTSRELSLAKAGFTDNIGYVKKALERREKDSAAFWAKVQSDPTAVHGQDPMSTGADYYLDNVSRDWFVYSGKDFENEVATEMQSRAAEYLRSRVVKDPALVDKLTRIQKTGVTNEELALASPVADKLLDASVEERKAYYDEHGTDEVTKMLVETLINRYDATGAREADLTPDQTSKLISRGKAGWSRGIGKTEYKDFDDAVYNEQRDMRKMAQQHAYDIAKLREQDRLLREREDRQRRQKLEDEAAKNGLAYGVTMGATADIHTPGWENYVKATEKQDKYYRDGQVVNIIDPDTGTSYSATDTFDATRALYETEDRKAFRRNYGGYDLARSPKKNGTFTVEFNNGASFELKARPATDTERMQYGLSDYGKDAVVVYDSKTKEIWEAGTQDISRATHAYNERLRKYTDANPDIKNKVLDPEHQAKMREAGGYSPVASWDGFHNYMNTKENVRTESVIGLVGVDKKFDDARENFGRAIVNQYQIASSSNTLGPDSRIAIHKVTGGGMSYDDKGTTDLGHVLGVEKDGTTIKTNTLNSIGALLWDISQGRGDRMDGTAPHVRFTSSLWNNDVFVTEPIAFGGTAENVFTGKGAFRMADGSVQLWSPSEIIALAMQPIFERDLVQYISDEQSRLWGETCASIFGVDPATQQLRFPTITEDGVQRPVTEKEVASSKNLQERIREVVTTRWAIPTLARFRDAVNNK